MEWRQCTGMLPVLLLVFVVGVSSESGFLVTAPQELFINSPEKICATFFNLQEKSVSIRIKDQFSGVIHAEISETPDADDVCLTLKVPVTALPSSHGPSSSGQLQIEAEVTGRTTDGRPFIEIQQKNIHVTNVQPTRTYIQTDKPIYKAGQTVKFRILTLEYPDLKPHIQKIRRIYVEEPGGRRVQQWNDVDMQAGLAELEMPLSPEPPTGEWTIFAAVGKAKIRQTFKVGEYVLPKFGVTITSQPSYMYKGAQEIAVKVCAEYSYGEPVRGAIQANFSLTLYGDIYNGDSIVSRQIEDTGSDGCHTFQLGYGEIGLTKLMEQYWYTSPKLHVDATFTEQGTDVSFVECADVAKYEHSFYTLWIEGPSTFKPGLPYHGSVRLTYPDNYPVNNKDVVVELTNYEGGDAFKSKVIVRVTNGGGKFEFTTPLNALNTNLKLDAKVTAHEGEPHAETIRANKYVQAWYSPSGSFLYVPPPYANKQSGQEDSIEVDYTIPSGQATMTFHYKIIARGNIVHTGQHIVNNQPSIPAPVIPVIEIQQPDLGIAPVPLGQFGQMGQRVRKSMYMPPSHGRTTIEEPNLAPYQPSTVAHLILPFNITSYMGPESQVLVYYIRDDGEVVSGHTQFFVSNIFENQVSLEFTSAEARPAAPIQLTVNASPQSLCAVGVVDKSVHILRDSNQLTAKKVQEPLNDYVKLHGNPNPSTKCSGESRDTRPQFNPGPQPRPQPPQGIPRDWLRMRRDTQGEEDHSRQTRTVGVAYGGKSRIVTTKFSRHLDALAGFQSAGMVVLTNLDVENRPCYLRRQEIMDRGRYPYSRRGGGPEGRPGRPGDSRPMAVPMGNMGPMGPDFDEPMFETVAVVADENGLAESVPKEDTSPLVEIRSYFPETWLWQLTTTGDSGSTSIDSEVPHTITEWVANGFCTSAGSGFGIAEPVELRAFQPFFLSYNLPYSAFREETIPVDVTVFNYLTDCFTIELEIDHSTEFSLVDSSRNKYICVCDRESQTVNFTIIPRQLGEIKITVHGSYAAPGPNVPFCGNNAFMPNVNGVRDAIEDTLLVEPEGVEREETFSEMVCLDKNGPDFNTVVPLTVPPDVIQDSARSRVFISGDMMSSVLSNLDSILRMPTGCGEQNMVKFAPNIYVLDYLTSTDQLTMDIEKKALEFLRIGYQRELTYRLNDGSYSAFGESDAEGSTWLTAFVLKSYVQANRFIDIDTKDIIVTQNWLLKQQESTTGCFRNRGILRHQSMKGGVSDEVTLTAYVLAALLEAGISPDDRQVILAEQCITARLTEMYSDPYEMALVSYALLLAENPDGPVALQQLDTLAHVESGQNGPYLWKTGGIMYWERTDLEPTDIDCMFCRAKSAAVEMTSYALLAYMATDREEADAMPIVQWMNQQRSAMGGYSSTQDTVMGLQSLSQYASLVYRNNTNLAIDVVKTSTGAFLDRFVLTSENQLLTQRMELAAVPTTLTFDARGEGCALIQAEIRYNVPAVRTIQRDPFEVTLDMMPPDNQQHCGKKTLITCVRYIGPRDATNMAAVEFKMVTGYHVDMESLAMYVQQHGQTIGLKRVDPPSKGNPLVLYFDYFDSTQRCFEVEVKQKVFVDSAKPASIKVYDYYEPGVKTYKSYNTCPPKDEKANTLKPKP